MEYWHGSLEFKNVSQANFDIYKISLEDNISKMSEVPKDVILKNNFLEEIKIIIFFWIIGMSVVGTVVLIGYVGYKGFSLGYTISTLLKLFGITKGNEYIFQNLFIKNIILVFIMIFMANYSLKIAKNFLVYKANIKIDLIKYTVVTIFTCISVFVLYLIQLLIL